MKEYRKYKKGVPLKQFPTRENMDMAFPPPPLAVTPPLSPVKSVQELGKEKKAPFVLGQIFHG